MRFRSKPVTTTYVEALHDNHGDAYFAHEVDKDGKAIGAVVSITAEEFNAKYEPVLRTPRAAVPTPPKAVAK